MLFRLTTVACAIAAAFSLPFAQAESVTAASAAAADHNIEVIVVTASGYEQKLVDAPASVSVVTREDLQNKSFTSLADALRDIEGIDVGSGQDKNGNISITMRGLPSDYTLVLIDGRRQSDVGDIGPNNFGNSQFMYMPPLEAIERIEVVRGPMSTLYGADAIGGVINIITRKQLDSTHGSITVSSNLQQDSQYGDDKKADLYLTGPTGASSLTYALRGSIYDRDESAPTYSANLPLPDGSTWVDEGSFGDKKIVAAKNWNLGGTLNYALSEQQFISLEYDIAKQRYDNTEGQTGTLDSATSLWRASGAGVIQPRVGYTPYQRVEREQWILAHVGRFDFGTLTSSITQSRSENFGRSLPLTVEERGELQTIWNQQVIAQGKSKPALTPALAEQLQTQFLPRPTRTLQIDNLIIDTKLESQYQDHYFVLGAQYFNAEMEDGVFGMYGDGFRDGTSQTHRQVAVFAEDSWEFDPEFTATLGARFDNHNIFGDQFSPRAYLNYRPTEQWTVKGGVSTGYKAPKPNQLFSGITGFGGQGVSPFVGTPDLQPETSVNYELAAYYSNDMFSGNITLFYNDFSDKIINQDNLPNCETAAAGTPCVDIGPGWAELGYNSFTQAANVDKAETRGVELSGKLNVTDSISLTANYTYTDSEVKSGRDAGLPLVSTPKNMLNATVNWQLLDEFSMQLIAEVRGERFRGTANISGPTGPETISLYYKSYELLHLGAKYQYSDQLSFSARINNLLDDDLSSRTCLLADTQDTYNCTADYNTTEKARSLWLALSYKF
ncbi:TonB-dependent receptor [Rheinheimera sp. D18]|uniref:TonB-dependent receptor domain-containing protein n=1 Tax=Rheinheimera sp. D18 TaxID=2545632 RepID=UPI0010485D56|nr:TonB-dependent receptor [Rheinheimera sp. D18]QBL08164.1 TonB-dependent receptor [Rheinheimera sp. D18]